MKMILAALAMIAMSAPALAQPAQNATSTPAAGVGAQGTGVVKKLNPKAGMVTLQHAPIASLGWPAMTMDFKIDPSLLKGLKLGQRVAFSLKAGGTPEVVAIKAK